MSIRIDNRESLFFAVDQIAADEVAARFIVRDILASDLEELWDEPIPGGWKTPSVVIELTERADDMTERDPERAVDLLRYAIAVSSGIEPGSYPSLSVVFAETAAWKVLGRALSQQGSYSSALRALDAGEATIAGEPFLSYAAARLRSQRAGTLAMLRKAREATEILAETRLVFEQFGALHRLAVNDEFEAMVRYFARDFEGARQSYESLIDRRPFGNDRHSLALCHLNLGMTYRQLGDPGKAIEMFGRARDLFLELNMPSELNRADWGIGGALLDQGRNEEAVTTLARARDRFADLAMHEDAGLVGLLLADGLLALGRVREARKTIKTVLTELNTAQVPHHMRTALLYLRDVLATDGEARTAVKDVYGYLEARHFDPEKAFEPPQN